MGRSRFPEGFLWGTATSAYQIEGDPLADGAGESIWHRFCREPGRIVDGSNGDVACRHYRLWKDDIDLMRDLGVQAYRFSIAWPRIFPTGRGRINRPGLDFYERLVDGLLEAGIEPAATLYHWDLPWALRELGGWPARDTARFFADYAAAVLERLGDRVRFWMTLNEPAISAVLGYLTGDHAPGWKDPGAAVRAAHHLMLGHGLAVAAMRDAAPSPIRIGIAVSVSPAYPATGAAEDRDAADRWDEAHTYWYLDPVYRSTYPAEILERLGPLAPPIRDGDLETMGAPIDFLGINYYSRTLVRHAPGEGPIEVAPQPALEPRTDMGWEIFPEGLYRTLTMIRDRYDPGEIYITENGAAFRDAVRPNRDGEPEVDDPDRIAFVRDHLLQVRRAIDDGVPVRGYFLWSLMDNFEWAFGYTKRFGIVYVDFETQRRILKRSGRWYAEVIRTNGIP